jgi:hypothetical protein
MSANFDMLVVAMSLSSYRGNGAADVLAALRDVGADCTDGFTITQTDDTTQIGRIADQKVDVGEDAVAWSVTMKMDGEDVPAKAMVVRQGATLVYFSAINFSATVTGKGTEVPATLIQSQLAKLG